MYSQTEVHLSQTAVASPSPQNVNISIKPDNPSLQAGQSEQFIATVAGTFNPRINWSLSPNVGTISNGLYTAPATISAPQIVTVTATNAAASTQTGTASLTVQASAPPAVTNIVLPIEVMGASSGLAPVSFSVPAGSNLTGQLQLWLQIHGLEYQTQASLEVNNGSWIAINNTTATYLGHGATFGGIGGGFATLQLTLNLPSGSIHTGQNTLTFRFNQTDGISSGFRVLNLNVLAADGSQLIPQSTFTQDDPSTWTPPLNDPADIQAGQSLWQTGNLTAPGSGAIQAKCGSCHAQDGRDLKYFNYSNLSIQVRAMFHGLTAQQGNQIASYIRTLNAPASPYGRPWNPPYQPGPGMDSRSVSDWSAGAGIDAVLDNDADSLAYIMPGGSTANLQANGYMNQREIPIDLQLRDWNHWLPTVHPLDAFGAQFTTSGLSTGYTLIRSELIPNDPTTYLLYYKDTILQWLTNQNNLFASVTQGPTSPAWNNPTYDREIYSVGQWMMVKSWEINHEYGLEAMAPVVFGPQSADRAWYTNQAFFTSPFMLKIPKTNSPGIGNGSLIAFVYDSFIWYQTQLILNDGNGTAEGTWPIDRGYSLSYLTNDLTWDSVADRPRVGTAGLMMEWLAKILQTHNDPQNTNPYFLILFPGVSSTWSEISNSEKIQLMNTWDSTWLNYVQTLTPSQLFTAPVGVAPSASPTFSAAQGNFTGNLVFALPQLRYQGVDTTVLNQIAQWASSYWPTYNWTADLNTSCALTGTDTYSTINCP
jgi:hypothetical protein